MEKRIIFHGHTLRPTGTPVPHDLQLSTQRIFLLSPANASGIRAKGLLSGRTQFDLALRLRTTGAPLDRKSTRLNSSHVAISYAVFCLKKKKYKGGVTLPLMFTELCYITAYKFSL